MLKNRQQNENSLPTCENGSAAAEMENSNSAGCSTAETATDSATSNGSAIANGINNNHHDYLDGEGEELSSTVVIEMAEDPVNGDFVYQGEDLTTEDMETTVDDGAGSSSQDDGMISSEATSTSSSVISVDRQMQLDQPRPVLNVAAAAPADQPEVTDFLDMDFDVEPTSTDEDEENGPCGKEKAFKRDSALPSTARTVPCQHGRDNEAEDGDFEFGDEECDAGPSTSFSSNNQSTVSKQDFTGSASESFLCVHGCPACNNESLSRRGDRKPTRPSTATFEKVPILGDLPSTSNASSAANSRLPRWAQRTQWYNYCRWTEAQTNRLTQPGINIAGPDGLRLARSAYVGFPSGQRVPGSGYSTSRAGVESGVSYRIWSLDEAEAIQATQIGPSMCGATALLNVFKALGYDIGSNGSGPGTSSLGTISVRDVERAVPTRHRACEAPLAEYLLSRSVAGTDAEDLIEAAGSLTNSRVVGRFFPMTERTIMTQSQEEQFGQWLLDWLKKGAVPVLTLNMQRGLLPVEPMPDAWHHQMAFGVCTRTGGVFLTNPLECVPLWFLKHALCSTSVLLVKTEDVRQRWNGRSADLAPLLSSTSLEESMESRPIDSLRWTEMNVIGQIARTLRQTIQAPNTRPNEPSLTHISIPARYRSGVTLFALADSEVWTAVSNAPNIDVALTVPRPSRTDLPDPVIEWGEEASSVLITIGDEAVAVEMDDGGRVGRSTSDELNADVLECADEHCAHSQSCDMM